MPKQFRAFWAFKPVADAGDGVKRAEMVLSGEFSDFDWSIWYPEYEAISAQKFRRDLAAIGQVDELTIRINSLGGYLVAAIVIHSLLKEYTAKKIGIVEGVAASAATVVLCACDVIKMHVGTRQLIHNCADLVYDYKTADDHEKAAADLRKWDSALMAIYQQRTGKSEEEISAQMSSDAWMTPEECQAFGLCDEVIGSEPVTATRAEGDNPDIWNIAGRLFDMGGMSTQPVAMLRETPDAAADGEEPAPEIRAGETPALQSDVSALFPFAIADGCALIVGEQRFAFTAASLAEHFPGLVSEIRAAAREEGITAERERQIKLDSYRTDATAEIIAKAKADGTAPGAVCELIVEAGLKGQAGLEFLRQRAADAHASGANGVAAGVAPAGGGDDAEVAAIVETAKVTGARLR